MVQAFLKPIGSHQALQADVTVAAAELALQDSSAAAGALIRGMARQTGSEIDEFVTDVLRDNLLSLPLDSAAINIARGRDVGLPTLNELRATVFDLVVEGAGSLAGRVELLNSPGAWADVESGLNLVDLWNGGLAEATEPFDDMLSSTFNCIFEQQMEDLQDGDGFYYLGRVARQNLPNQLEQNSFANMIVRNTDIGDNGEVYHAEAIFQAGTAEWGEGDIILGGAGSDLIEGGSGDDISDNDLSLDVRLLATDANGNQATAFKIDGQLFQVDANGDTVLDANGEMIETQLNGHNILQAAVFDRVVNPGDLEIVCELLHETYPLGNDTDTVEFSDVVANFKIVDQTSGASSEGVLGTADDLLLTGPSDEDGDGFISVQHDPGPNAHSRFGARVLQSSRNE